MQECNPEDRDEICIVISIAREGVTVFKGILLLGGCHMTTRASKHLAEVVPSSYYLPIEVPSLVSCSVLFVKTFSAAKLQPFALSEQSDYKPVDCTFRSFFSNDLTPSRSIANMFQSKKSSCNQMSTFKLVSR